MTDSYSLNRDLNVGKNTRRRMTQWYTTNFNDVTDRACNGEEDKGAGFGRRNTIHADGRKDVELKKAADSKRRLFFVSKTF